jgi:hypothetical protein
MFGENTHFTASAESVKNKYSFIFNKIKVGTGFDKVLVRTV